jgi:heterodisulfide reductase subunit C
MMMPTSVSESMNQSIPVGAADQTLLTSLDPDGELHLSACLQCARCSSGCTMRQETDLLPHQLNRMALLGLREALLRSRAIWMCVSCQTCVSRCPMGVDTPAMIDRLRALASEAPDDLRRVRVFNQALLGSVRRFGRVYELGLMAAFKLRARDFLSDVGKLPAMLRKGKLRLLPPFTRGRKAVARIFAQARRAGEGGR